jgi:O-acetyl-ADP-ribose deacetylase (regulator of RNase III)
MSSTQAPITYLSGDATQPATPGPKVIAHICNDAGGWGSGFVVAVSRRWKEPELAYRRLASQRPLPLGMVQLIRVTPDIEVANLLAQHGYKNASNPVAVRYDQLRLCLEKLGARLHDLYTPLPTIHMPRIGCGLAGGTWDQVEPIIQATLSDRGLAVYVYDLPT